jgi:DNA-binding transcriptional LysR family regulator
MSSMRQYRFSWDDLQLFLEIARAGTLTAAAQRLKLSQPTAGRRLRTLEDAIGSALFQRSSSGFRLTDEGETMLVHAERMEEEAVTLERRIAGGSGTLEGVLRVSSSDWFASRVLAPGIADFAVANPLITVELLADFRLLDLQRREADVVFRFVPFSGPDIVQKRLAHIRYGLYASESYLERNGDPRRSDGGSGHFLIAMDSAFDQVVDVAWLRSLWPQARLSVRSNSRDVQAEACMRAAGLAVLPCVIGDHLPLRRLDGLEVPGRDIWLGYHEDLRRLRRLRSLVDHLSARIEGEL